MGLPSHTSLYLWYWIVVANGAHKTLLKQEHDMLHINQYYIHQFLGFTHKPKLNITVQVNYIQYMGEDLQESAWCGMPYHEVWCYSVVYAIPWGLMLLCCLCHTMRSDVTLLFTPYQEVWCYSVVYAIPWGLILHCCLCHSMRSDVTLSFMQYHEVWCYTVIYTIPRGLMLLCFYAIPCGILLLFIICPSMRYDVTL